MIDNLYRGVRTSSGALGQALSQALRPYRVPGVEAPANFSAQLSTSGRPLATLYRGYQAVVRTGDYHRFVTGLLMNLAPADRLLGHVAVRMGVVIHAGEAVLTPSRISILPHLLASPLLDQGYQIVDAPLVNLDPSKMTVTVSPPNIEIDELPWKPGLGPRSHLAAVGTYPIKAVVLESGSEAPSLLEVIAHLLARAAVLKLTESRSMSIPLLLGSVACR